MSAMEFWPTHMAKGAKTPRTQMTRSVKSREGGHRHNLEEVVAEVEAKTLSPPSISSAEVSPASRYPLLANSEPNGMIGGSGPSSHEWFAQYDPDTCSWKTCQACLLTGWAMYSETWPPSGTMRNGKVYRRPPLVPRTSVTESSLWVGTPGGEAMAKDAVRSKEFGKGRTPSPQEMARKGLWPTLRANSAMAATITEDADPDRYPNLETVLKKTDPSAVGGQLNPMWIEWLMGFPPGWTDLEHSETR